MEVKDIVWRLAHLASLSYQERYVIGGTIDEYVLAAELLEDVDAIKYRYKNKNSPVLDIKRSSALEELFSCIDRNAEEALTAGSRAEVKELIRNSDAWKELRAKASHALKLFGISIDSMSLEQINALTD